MKPRGVSSYYVPLVIKFFVRGLFSAVLLWEDVVYGGDGPADILSPYDNAPDLSDVKRVRSAASSHTSIPGLGVVGSTKRPWICRLGLAYLGSGQPGSVFYAFRGRLAGGENAEVDLAEVTNFEVLSVDGSTAMLRITQFPRISSKDLLRKKPSYRNLRNCCQKKIKLEVDLLDERGRELYLVELDPEEMIRRKPSSSEDQNILANPDPIWFFPSPAVDGTGFYGTKIRDVEGTNKIQLYNTLLASGNYLWWAVPSVIADPSYPYKRYSYD